MYRPFCLFLLSFFSLSNLCVNMHVYQYALLERDAVQLELQSYKTLLKVGQHIQANYLAFPWAYAINNNLLHLVPNIRVDGGFTICQHVYFEKILSILRSIGINVLFTPHCTGKVYSGIRVLPFPHLAVNGAVPNSIKDILVSFIGLSNHPSRRVIFSCFENQSDADILCKSRVNWHYFNNDADEKQRHAREYQDVLVRSRFSLCPEGVGPGTLRFWESLQAGAIPILIDSTVKLPESFDWSSCTIQITSAQVSNVVAILRQISSKREQDMRNQCLTAYRQFSDENIVSYVIYCYKKIFS